MGMWRTWERRIWGFGEKGWRKDTLRKPRGDDRKEVG
jgi:hypothetical protein